MSGILSFTELFSGILDAFERLSQGREEVQIGILDLGLMVRICFVLFCFITLFCVSAFFFNKLPSVASPQ